MVQSLTTTHKRFLRRFICLWVWNCRRLVNSSFMHIAIDTIQLYQFCLFRRDPIQKVKNTHTDIDSVFLRLVSRTSSSPNADLAHDFVSQNNHNQWAAVRKVGMEEKRSLPVVAGQAIVQTHPIHIMSQTHKHTQTHKRIVGGKQVA